MVNETMYYPYQNTARQFREMEAQDIPVTIANLAIHRHREEEMNQERMRHNQTVQEAAAERAREENKGKAREVVPDSEEEGSEELHSSAFEEWTSKRLIINANIDPKTHGTNFDMKHALLIYVLMAGGEVNLPRIMRDILVSRPTKHSRHLLPYPVFISWIAARNELPEFPNDKLHCPASGY
ncbi:hypothetical protein PIB30_102634, partial [Stylosanthes scabra]|nr:hypothetical protein [Stylosanthes scabra]